MPGIHMTISSGLDPHMDTPVEILHTVLLGFVKYFWRDVVHNQLGTNTSQKDLLKTRLNSLDVSGLQIGQRVAGHTLVQYAGSLTGRDFRIIAQIAPFVLYDLVPTASFDAWVSLSNLVPLVWQPEIDDLDEYIVSTPSIFSDVHQCDCVFSHVLNLQSKNLCSVPSAGPHAGPTNPSFIIFSISLHISGALVLPCYLQQNRLSHSMLLSGPRVCTQTALHHHETLPLHLHTTIVCGIYLVEGNTSSEIVNYLRSMLVPSAPWPPIQLVTKALFTLVRLASGDRCPVQPHV